MLAYRARKLFLTAGLLALLPFAVLADGVSVRFDITDPAATPFPSDRFSVSDASNLSLRRVNLPRPDCTVRPSDCADVDVLNTLDGFSTQPRITVPFTGAIDPGTVNSQSVFLLNLGDTQNALGAGQRVGVNQVVWDPARNTLSFESDELLAQHSRYLLLVTNGVRDANGKRIRSGDEGIGGTRGSDSYARALRSALHSVRQTGPFEIVAASLFTTQSITADLEKIGLAIRQSTPAPVNFQIGNNGTARTVFAASDLAGIQFNRQTGTAPTFAPEFVPTPALNVIPGSVAQVAYGLYRSPNYQANGQYIPATATWTGVPAQQGSSDLLLQLHIPAGAKPPAGWPVAIFGHGFTDSMYGAPWVVASVLASRGIATLAINVVGHGGGAQGTLNVFRTAATTVVVPAGGRGFDQDGNGQIDSTEGVNAAAPRTLLGSRDGLRQTVVDLMQLVRQVQAGIDIDADGTADLDAQRIYYAGQSFGGIYGTIFLGVEPALKAGVPNVPGGSVIEVARLGAFRPLVAIALAQRVPQLLNLPPTPNIPVPFNLNFNENIPLRNQPALVNTVPGASAIQELLERDEWAQQSGNPVSYARHIRKQPLSGNGPKPVIIQFAKGDGTVPNPTATAILRAGDLADRATFFRNDLAFAAFPSIAKNPHTFLTNIADPAGGPLAVGGQMQIAIFFASFGTVTIDPDGPGPVFEVPINLPLPETLNLLP